MPNRGSGNRYSGVPVTISVTLPRHVNLIALLSRLISSWRNRSASPTSALGSVESTSRLSVSRGRAAERSSGTGTGVTAPVRENPRPCESRVPATKSMHSSTHSRSPKRLLVDRPASAPTLSPWPLRCSRAHESSSPSRRSSASVLCLASRTVVRWRPLSAPK